MIEKKKSESSDIVCLIKVDIYPRIFNFGPRASASAVPLWPYSDKTSHAYLLSQFIIFVAFIFSES